MPVIARLQDFPLDPVLTERLSRLTPALPLVPPARDALLYIGWFNERPVSAVWAQGPAEGRELVCFAIHPATRGRGVLARLAHAVRDHERADGRRVLAAQDYSSLDE